MAGFVKRHPLLFVIIVALILRMAAVIWSQGFIHSDDHFDTVEVAYSWLRDGLWGDNGFLRWKYWSSETIARFPLYTLTLYGVMKAYCVAGITSLNKMMYGIRLLHALISLLPVWAAFKITKLVSRKDSWAIFAGLLIAANFSLPFLGVRNLIEIVGGNIWTVALYYFYKYEYTNKRWRYLVIAGIITGLAWMIRFQIAFAVVPIPFILWYRYKSIRPALQYSGAVAFMLLLSGISDWYLLGSFASSTVKNLSMNASLGALYHTMPMMYPVELLLFLVPPFSFLAFYLIFRPGFWKKHLILFGSSLAFVVFHMSFANQQERFIMPIVPAMIILSALAVWEKYRRDGYIVRSKKLFKWLIIPSAIINTVLLVPLTFAYGHQGQIAPLVWIEQMDVQPSIMVFQPEIKQWMPMDYAGIKPPIRGSVRKWNELNVLRKPEKKQKHWDYVFIYPRHEEDLPKYIDSAETVFGKLEPVRVFNPSLYDRILHTLNRKYNPSFKCWVYRPAQKLHITQDKEP